MFTVFQYRNADYSRQFLFLFQEHDSAVHWSVDSKIWRWKIRNQSLDIKIRTKLSEKKEKDETSGVTRIKKNLTFL